jgi:hypothetical protein
MCFIKFYRTGVFEESVLKRTRESMSEEVTRRRRKLQIQIQQERGSVGLDMEDAWES